MIDPSILSSNILGGVIALIVAVGVSRWEFNRQAKEKKQNWYRAVHNTDEVNLPLFNALQNIQLGCIRFALEVDTPNPHKQFLHSRHETIIDFCQISMYLIEFKKDPDIEYLHELEGKELEEAKEKYEKFSEGTLYEEQNDRVRETIRKLSKLDE